jgi:hypothetical protein
MHIWNGTSWEIGPKICSLFTREIGSLFTRQICSPFCILAFLFGTIGFLLAILAFPKLEAGSLLTVGFLTVGFLLALFKGKGLVWGLVL